MNGNVARSLAIGLLLAMVSTTESRAQEATPRANASAATLAGIVRDSAGAPVVGAEIVVVGEAKTVRSAANGSFSLDSMRQGAYDVVVRKLGYVAAQFSWDAHANTRIEVAVTLQLLPRTLDPVTIYASEERSLASRSLVSGVVLDSTGRVLPGVEVALLGSGRATVSGTDGAFMFRHVAPGDLVVRSRMLGFAPAVAHVSLGENDERHLYIRMKALVHLLDAEEVIASGYGPSAVAFKEFDQRKRWIRTAGMAKILGPQQLENVGDLDAFSRTVPGNASELNAIAGSKTPKVSAPADACILVNGWRPYRRPLSAYAGKDLETLEFYPPSGPLGLRTETEPTQTLTTRFNGVQGCEGTYGAHPAYYVLWFKGERVP